MNTRLLPTHLLLTADLRRAEAAALALVPPGTLMQRAGLSAAALLSRIAGDAGGTTLVLAGPGNNGGDALVAALTLQRQGWPVRVALLDAPEAYRGDAKAAWEAWQQAGGASSNEPGNLDQVAAVIDGLYGIGLNRAVPARAAAWITAINDWQRERGRPVLALDIPSGLAADTGCILGTAICATHTLSFLAAKPGLYTADGVDCCGEIHVDGLGTGSDGIPGGLLNQPAAFRAAAPRRARNSHKGSFGSVGIIGGGPGMTGAALLAARMALHAGTGRVYLQLLGESALAVDPLQPELMLRQTLNGVALNACVIGPGMVQGSQARSELADLLDGSTPLVLDADALNLIGSDIALHAALGTRSGANLITPHPLEAARLLGWDTAAVQADRIASARRLAADLNSVVILKGAGSVIARPDGAWAINPTGNPALATGGTGDVLAGLAGSLLAQGWPTWEAALAATWLHGSAADALVASGVGPIGLTAAEFIPAIREQINLLYAAQAHGLQ